MNTKKPEMITMVGFPSSGKSTHAKKYFPDYVYVNQDTLKKRQKCLDLTELSCAAGFNLIIDRTNIDRAQRKIWIDIGKKYGYNIICLWMDTTKAECEKRILERKGHPTIKDNMPTEKKIGIVNKFFKAFEQPQIEEGFHAIIRLTPDLINDILKEGEKNGK